LFEKKNNHTKQSSWGVASLWTDITGSESQQQKFGLVNPHMCASGIFIIPLLAPEAFGGYGPTPLEAFGVEVQALSTAALEPYKTGLGKLDRLAVYSKPFPPTAPLLEPGGASLVDRELLGGFGHPF